MQVRESGGKAGRPPPSPWSTLRLLSDHYEAFTKKHYDKLQTPGFGRGGCVRPGRADRLTPARQCWQRVFATVHHVIPDFLLSVDGDDIVLQLNGRNAPELRVAAPTER